MLYYWKKQDPDALNTECIWQRWLWLRPWMILTSFVSRWRLFPFQSEDALFTCILLPQNKVGFVHLLVPPAQGRPFSDCFGMMKRVSLIQELKWYLQVSPASKSSKEGFRKAFERIRFKPNNPLRRNSIQVLSLKQEIKQSHYKAYSRDW